MKSNSCSDIKLLRKLLNYLASSVVNNPERIKIEQIETKEVDIFYLKVAKEDMGRVLGKRGKTADAIRCIMQAGANRLSKEVIIDIVE